jgi:hypothetical protein
MFDVFVPTSTGIIVLRNPKRTCVRCNLDVSIRFHESQILILYDATYVTTETKCLDRGFEGARKCS